MLFAAFLVKSPVLQFLVVLLMSLWWFGWSGTVFLSSTRVIFAAAIDRMLPEWVSRIEPRTKTPINALLLMVIPAVDHLLSCTPTTSSACARWSWMPRS